MMCPICEVGNMVFVRETKENKIFKCHTCGKEIPYSKSTESSSPAEKYTTTTKTPEFKL